MTHPNFTKLREYLSKRNRKARLAEDSGISNATLSRWQSEHCQPSLTALYKVLPYLPQAVREAVMGKETL